MDDEGSSAPATAGSSGRLPESSRLLVAGYILAVAFPIAGFIIGVILVNRPEKSQVRHGIWILVVSVIAAFILFVALIVSSHGSGAATEAGG